MPGLLLVGIGCSIAIPAVAAAAMSGVVPSQFGIASGVLNTSRQIGGVLGVAVLGTVVNSGSFSSMLPWALALIGVVQVAGGMTAFAGLRPATRRAAIAEPGPT